MEEKKRYYGGRLVEETEEVGNDLLDVHFSDGEEPKIERMSLEEFEGLTFDEPKEGLELYEAFIKCTSPLQKRLIGEFDKWNIRFDDLYRFRDLLGQVWNSAKEKLYREVFGIGQYDEMKISDTTKKAEGMKITPSDKITELEVDLLSLMVKHDLKFVNCHETIENAYEHVMKELSVMQKQVIEQTIGVKYEFIRLADIQQYYAAKESSTVDGEKQKDDQNNA
jgi:hypothetical protein